MDLRETLQLLSALVSGKGSSRNRHPRLLSIDPLEGRWTPAVTASVDGAGKLTITGDDAANDIVVSVEAGVVKVTDNGAVVAIGGGAPAPAAVTAISVDLMGNPGGTVDKLNMSAVGAGFAAALNGNVTLIGGEGADSIQGTQFDDEINGNAGNDTILGHNGSDDIFGEGDEDSLFGGEGSDFLSGGDQNDSMEDPGGEDVGDGGGQAGDTHVEIENWTP
jgi:Ca2+-binding RTX toxin-like protein